LGFLIYVVTSYKYLIAFACIYLLYPFLYSKNEIFGFEFRINWKNNKFLGVSVCLNHKMGYFYETVSIINQIDPTYFSKK